MFQSGWFWGCIAAAAWATALWVFFSYLASNNQIGRYEKIWGALGEELTQLRQAGDDAALETWLRQMTRRWNFFGWIHIQYAEFLERQERPDEAIRLLRAYRRRVKRIVSGSIRAAPWETYLLARILLKRGREHDALSEIRNGLQSEYAIAPLGQLYIDMAFTHGDQDDGMARYIEMIARFPQDAALAERYIRKLIELGRIEEAESELRDAIHHFPRAEALTMLYARLAHDRADWEEAVLRWAEARDNFVFVKQAYEAGAEALRQLGREDEAVAVLASRPRPVGVAED